MSERVDSLPLSSQEGSTIERAQERAETHCVAGHVGFEPANPSASYLTGIPWQLCLK
jgi:hypothetical protein